MLHHNSSYDSNSISIDYPHVEVPLGLCRRRVEDPVKGSDDGLHSTLVTCKMTNQSEDDRYSLEVPEAGQSECLDDRRSRYFALISR